MKKFWQKSVNYLENEKGLSLLEVLLALTIMSIVATVGFASFTNSLRRSRDTRRQADLEMVRGALEIYRADENIYPTGAGIGSDFAETITTLRGPPSYINSTPTDPKAGTWDYYYLSPALGNIYIMCAFIEGPVVTSPCAVPGTPPSCTTDDCNYCVCNP